MARSSSKMAGVPLELTPASASVFENLVHQRLQWSDTSAEHHGIVVSCRIRLARNLATLPFPSCAHKDELLQIIDFTQQKLKNIKSHNLLHFLRNSELSELEKLFLMERHLVSPDWIKLKQPAAVSFSNDEITSMMLNEEDHLRIQVLQPGLELHKAWELISQLDDNLGRQLNFAFSDRFGYLTACPTNTGTGMRVSATFNLVGLALTEKMDSILKDKFSNEIEIRGFYGEGTEVMGNIFQVSNRVTLGRSEESILERFLLHANQLIEMEEAARNDLVQKNRTLLEDKIFRARAILGSARILNTVECIQLINYLRIGVELNLLTGLSGELLNDLLLRTQPAHFQMHLNRRLVSTERNVLRSGYIKKILEL
jgi:protein arginine kinase